MSSANNTLKPIRIILLGDQSVGKTCLLHRFVYGKFMQIPTVTVGSAVESVSVNIEGIKVLELQIFDTGGQERFNSITRSYYRGTSGVILVYDVTNMASFTALTGWLKEIRDNCDEDVKVVIVGNKIDDKPKKAVIESTAKSFAAENDYKYLEASASENHNVDRIFRTLIQEVLTLSDEDVAVLNFSPVTSEDSTRQDNSLPFGRATSRISQRMIQTISTQLGITEEDQEKVVLHSSATQTDAQRTGCLGRLASMC